MILVQATGPLATLQDLGRPAAATSGSRPPAPPTGRRSGSPTGWSATPRAAQPSRRPSAGSSSPPRLAWVAVTGAPTQLLVNATATSSSTHHRAAPRRPAGHRTAPAGTSQLPSRTGWARGATGPRQPITDVLSGLGPAPLRAGPGPADRPPASRNARRGPGSAAPSPANLGASLPGPRQDWFYRLPGDAWSTTPGR